jgi:Ca2+-transporting ATPase
MQILFLNLVTDVFPALALGVSPGSDAVMARPPRDPRESILPASHWPVIVGHALVITASTLGAMAIAMLVMGMDYGGGVTVSFLTLALAQLWHVFNARDSETGVFRNDITANPYIWGALVICVGLILMGMFLPGLSTVLRVEALGWKGWGLVLGMSFIPWVTGAALHVATQRRAKGSSASSPAAAR